MKPPATVWLGLLICLFAPEAATAAALKQVALPSAEGWLAGAAFSPDSSHLAVVRNIASTGISASRRVLQIVELKTGQEAAHAEVLNGEQWDPRVHIEYSPDGKLLLLVANLSDVLWILDAATFQTMKRPNSIQKRTNGSS
jgi:hypothetical protein